MNKKDIDTIIKNAKKLAKTKTENELFEKIGKEVSKTKFQDKFKPGDIICSDRFLNGSCMVVESGGTNFEEYFRYRCNNLVRDDQNWLAYEFCQYKHTNNDWRIATDDDIAKYLSRFLHIPLGSVGFYNAELTDSGITIVRGDEAVLSLEAEELAQLGKIINERVVG